MRRVLGTVGIAAVVAVLGTAAAAAADAPANTDTLVAASPDAGAVLSAAPSAVTLDFAAPVEEGSVTVRVFDGDGALRATGPVVVDGQRAVAELASVPSGRYLVDWDAVVGAEPASGAYLFTIDPSGAGAIGVTRAIDDGGWPVTFVRLAALAVAAVALGIGVAATRKVDTRTTPRRLAMASAAIAGAMLVGFAAGVAVSEGTIGGVVSPSAWGAAATGSAGWWLVGLVAMLGMPYLLVRAWEDPATTSRTWWRAAAGSVLGVALVATVGAASAAFSERPLVVLPTLALVVAAVLAVAPQTRRVGVITALTAVTGMAVIGASGLGDDAVGERVTVDSVALEFDIAPGRVGVNEFHIYGFDTQLGGLATLEDAVAWARLPSMGVGPLRIDMLRAGPNHFLTYAAELPLAGEWEIDFVTGTAESPNLTATVILETE